MIDTLKHETVEPEVDVIDDPDYSDVEELLDPCPPLDELVSPEVAEILLKDEKQLL